MNIVGHWWLTRPLRAGILAGNLMGDFVKGKAYLKYDFDIQQGILLHRAIDSFTDTNAHTRELRRLISRTAERFGFLVVDVLYDHFLCLNWQRLYDEPFEQFVQKCYAMLDEKADIFPESLKTFYAKMKHQNWLFEYRDPDRFATILRRMGHRMGFMAQADKFTEQLPDLLPQIEPVALAFLNEAQIHFHGIEK